MRFAIALFSLISISIVVKAKTAPADTAYHLVWADEFNSEGAPNPKNWVFEQGFVRNHEDQWYQPQNAVCHNGLLVIEARKEHRPNPNYDVLSSRWQQGRKFIEYTSASLNTSGLHSWKYGRMVMRARIPTDPGLWPAFWTLGVSGQWPSNGEIDVMEYYRNMLLANIATGTETPYKALWYSTKKPLDTFGADWSKKFHTWCMDWDEKAISLYVDDQLLNRVELKYLVNHNGTGINPFMQPHYILLNMALGGDNGGNLSKTKFPQRFEVDYVRVYQRIE